MTDLGKVSRLVVKAKAGDSRAFTKLYKTYFSYVFYNALKYLGDEHSAREAAQETFISVNAKIEGLEDPMAFHKWITVITYHTCADIARNKKRELEWHAGAEEEPAVETVFEEDDDFIPEKYLEVEERRKEVIRLVDTLPLSQRRLVTMYYLGDLSVVEIAKITEEPEGTINKRLFDARNALRKKLDPAEQLTYAHFTAGSIPAFKQIIVQDAAQQTFPEASREVFNGLVAKTAIPKAGPLAHIGSVTPKTVGVSLAAALALGAGVYAASGLHGREEVAPRTPRTSESAGATNSVAPQQESEPIVDEDKAVEDDAAEPLVENTDSGETPTTKKRDVTQKRTATKTVKTTPAVSPKPVVTVAHRNLSYPEGTIVPVQEIIVDSGASAVDGSGASIPITPKSYKKVDFMTPGSYFMLFSAQDQAGKNASPVSIRITIERADQ